MSRQMLLRLMIGLTLVLLLLACDVLQPTPTPNVIETGVAGTKTAVAWETAIAATLIAEAPTVTWTPTPMPPTVTLTPVSTNTATPPRPTATYTPIPTTTLAYKVTMSVKLEQPVVLKDNQVEVTVTEVSNAGDCVGKNLVPYTTICVKPEYKGSYYLLNLKIAVKNLTSNKDLGFGTKSLLMLDDKGDELLLHWCYSLDRCISGLVIVKLPAGSAESGHFIVAVPKTLEKFTLHLLGASSWKE